MTTGLILIIFIGVIFIANARRADTFRYKDALELKVPCEKISSLISNAASMGHGGKLTDKIEFNTTILGQTRQIMIWKQTNDENRTHYCSYSPYNVTNGYNTSFTIPPHVSITFANVDGEVEVRDSVLEEGLVANFRMDKNKSNTYAIDNSDFHYTGELKNGANCGYDGFRKKSCSFDGNDDVIETSYYHKSQEATISYWVNFNTLTGNSAFGYYESTGDSNFFLGFQGTSNHISAGYGSNSNMISQNTITGGINDGQWHMLTLSINQTHAGLYHNGNLISSEEDTGGNYFDYNTNSYGKYFYIGSLNGKNEDIDGMIDDVRIYNRALTQEEVKRLYDSYFNYVIEQGDNYIR